MKRKLLLLFVMLLSLVLFVACENNTTDSTTASTTTTTTIPDSSTTTSEKIYTPEIIVTNKSITLYIGDKLELLDGVSATGLHHEDVSNQIEVIHQIPVDDSDKVTTAGSYNVAYKLTINGIDFTETASVTVIKLVSFENGDFENGVVDPFTKSDFEGAGSSLSIITDENNNHLMKLQITAVSWGAAAPRVEYQGLDLDESKIYEITFDAYADSSRVIHAQVGELLSADPWFKAAYGLTKYFTLTTEKQTFTWTVQPTATLSNADLSNLSFLLEFGKMANGGTSVATTVYLDNFTIKEVTNLEVDKTAPVIIPPTDQAFYIGDSFNVLSFISAIDELGETPTFSIVDEESTLPPVDENNKLTTAGNYIIVYKATDLAGNYSTYKWNLEVQEAAPIVNGFNLTNFQFGSEGDLSEDTVTGFIYSDREDTTFDYSNSVLTVTTNQSKTEDAWTSTQIFARCVRVSGASQYTLSFDIESTVSGVIQVNGRPYYISVGTNHIAIEKYMFNYNYVVLSIQLGVYKGLQLPGDNIGPCTVKISNISVAKSTSDPDTIPPVITRNSVVTYFVGDAFDALSTVSIYDYRDKAASVTINTELSTLPPVDEAGKTTTAGVYTIVFDGVDASGNTTRYESYYTVREPLVNHDGFSVEQVTYGTEAELDDPSVVYLWNDNGVHVTKEVIDANNFKITSDQGTGNDIPWYATQLFMKTLRVDTWGLYTLSYDIISNVNGVIKLDGAAYELKVGTNHIEKQIAIPAGSSQKISIQFGKEEYGTIGAFEIEFRNLKLQYIPEPEETTWYGAGMTVSKDGDASVITYENIPDPWYQVNGRTYIFNTNNIFQAVAVKFKGTAGHTYQFKFEGLPSSIFEASTITADGTEQTVIIDTRNRTEGQRLLMHNLLVFCTDIGASGSVTIYGYTMYDKFTDAFDTKWLGMGMSVVDSENSSTITYESITSDWWVKNAQYIMDNVQATTTSIQYTFTGTAGHEYLFKIEGGGYSKEASVIATGDEQTFTLDISSISEANRIKLNLSVVFCKTAGASGTITIYSVNEAS